MEVNYKSGDIILILTHEENDSASESDINSIKDIVGNENVKTINTTLLTKSNLSNSSFDIIISKCHTKIDDEILTQILKLLKPNGKLFIQKSPLKDCTTEQLVSSLKLSGFVNINESVNELKAQKPDYEIGSSMKLNIRSNKKSAKIWTLAADDAIDDDVELINDNDLLDDSDFKKPEPESLRVCGTTKQRKACADCTCGLAEELEQKVIENIKQNTQNAKSSCGSCYLGDAFRCASCPYFGMPAFKPGEKVTIDNTSDI